MARNRNIDALTEILVVLISPALVMFMVGSLCFFAIRCFYVGSFVGRLNIATGLFVFAAVLVSRISIEEGREYASMFAVPLSIVTLLSVLKYTDAGVLFLVPLVAFIWWSTDKLTWDCTVVDHKQDASGKGLLQTMGIDSGSESGGASNDATVLEDGLLDLDATTDKKQADRKSIWQQWVQRRRRTHTPGVWVIYFGIAAIPIFGLGQTLLPARQLGPSFILLCVYVASALALLMATSFLQMRRYLNQRRLEISDGMAGIWLSSGGTLIVALMVLCLFLPRPNTGYSLVEHISKIGSNDHRASRYSMQKQDAVEDKDVDGDGESDEAAERDSNQGTQKPSDAERGSEDGDDAKTEGQKQSDRGEQSSDSDQGDPKKQSEQRESQRSDAKRNGDESTDRDASEGHQSQNDARNEAAENRDDSESKQPEDADDRSETDAASDEETSRNSSRPNFIPKELPDILPSFSMPPIPKLLYFAVIGAIVLFVLLRYGKQIAAALSAFMRDFLDAIRRLFGGRSRSEIQEELDEAVEESEPPRPFSSYPDPFSMGTVDQFSTQQLVDYTFEAFQAWASERDCARGAEQTPLEFAVQVGSAHRKVGSSARDLAQLYNQVAYAPGTIRRESLEHLRKLWKVLRSG